MIRENLKAPEWQTSPGVFFVLVSQPSELVPEIFKGIFSIHLKFSSTDLVSSEFIDRKMFRKRSDGKLVFPLELNESIEIFLPSAFTSDQARNLIFNLDLLKESLNSFYLQIAPEQIEQLDFVFNHFRKVVLNSEVRESQLVKKDLTSFSGYIAEIDQGQLTVKGDVVSLIEWNEFVWRKSQFKDFSVLGFLQRFKWFFTILMMLGILFMPKDLPREWVDVVSAQAHKYDTKQKFNYYQINDYAMLRRVSRSYFFQNGFAFHTEAQLDSAIAKLINESFSKSDQQKIDLTNKKLLKSIPEIELPKINSDSFIIEKLKANELKNYKRWSRMLNDSLAYPTDFYYDQETKSHRLHRGIDLAGQMDSRIHSPISGRAIIGESDRAGRFIAVVDSVDIVFFAHCDKFLFLNGENVRQGDAVATVGLTGHTTGPHVHLGTGRINPLGAHQLGNEKFDYVDPVLWIEGR